MGRQRVLARLAALRTRRWDSSPKDGHDERCLSARVAPAPHLAHLLVPVDGPHRTYQCERCEVILSGLTERDLVLLQHPNLARCTVGW